MDGIDIRTKQFKLADPTTLTIAGGIITQTRNNHAIDTEGASASDNLDTITYDGVRNFLVLRPANNARTVVVKNGAGNINLAGADFTMDNSRDRLVLLHDGSNWIELSRCDGGA